MSASNFLPADFQLEIDYERFILDAADGPDKLKPQAIRGLDRFKSLKAFLRTGDHPNPRPVSEPKISIITFQNNGSCDNKELVNWAADLPKEIKNGSDPKLIIVQNISPKAIRILGGQLKVDPLFFSDYIDAMPSIFDVTKQPKRIREDIIPIPWYNIEKLEPHLPELASLKSDNNYIQMRFIGAREYQGGLKHEAVKKERMRPDLNKMNTERTAGLHVPIARKGISFDHIALTRHCASIWFNTTTPTQQGCSQWNRAIILLDPPFEVDDTNKIVYGTRTESVYRSFVSRPLPFEVKGKDIDSRDSYKDSMVHYILHTETLKNNTHPHPLLVIQGLARIISSEWLVVNTCIERDLNSIEWILETEDVTLEVFEGFIKRLFILRRRIGKYNTLVSDQLDLFQHQMPLSWRIARTGETEKQVFAGMKDDLVQVQKAINRNTARITQTLELITSIMSVRQGETSITQNQTLGFLTILATVALPFNTIATIVGLQTAYAPGQESWQTYLIASISTVGVIATVYFLFSVYVRFRGHRVGLH